MENNNNEQNNQNSKNEKQEDQLSEQKVQQQQQQQQQQNPNDSWVDEDEEGLDKAVGQDEDDEIFLDEDEMNDLNEQLDEMDNELLQEQEQQHISEEEEENEQEEEKLKETTKNPDQSIQQLKFHTSFGCCIKVNQSNTRMFFTGAGDDLAAIWNLDKDQKNPTLILKGHTDSVDNISINFDNTLLATSSLDSTVKIWNINTGELKFNLEGPSQEISFIDWHDKGNAIIAGSQDNSIYMWNGNNGQYMQSFYGHEKALTAGQFSPNGKFIVSVSEDASLRVWNPKTAENIHKISDRNLFHSEIINCLGIHKTSQIAVTGCQEGFACLSSINTGKILGKTKNLNNGIEKICISEKHDCFFAGTLDGTIFKLDFNKLVEKGKFQCDDSISQLHIIDDSHLIMCSTFNGTIYVFDHRQDQKITVLTNPETIHDFSWDLQNKLIYAICEDGSVKIFQFN